MNLNRSSWKWSIEHLHKFGDTDLFPRPIEYEVFHSMSDTVISECSNININRDYSYGSARNFIVPKDELSYRSATQLDPMDELIFTAIIYQFGNLIENRRLSKSDNRVFSYRYAPTPGGSLYDLNVSWTQFWEKCLEKSSFYSHAIYLDICDFYNQIYSHTIENQLIESGFPNEIAVWITNLLKHLTAGVSRGIPVGPHASHLLAEMSMIPIDNSLVVNGFDFCRFVDDIIIFCHDEEMAKIANYKVANILDKQQKLILQRQKTKIFNREDFQIHCRKMIEDRPINEFEKEIFQLIKKNAGNNPYVTVDVKNLTNHELKMFTTELLEKILSEYLASPDIDYIRVRWFLRRLAQVKTGNAVDYCLNHLQTLTPAISDVCHYLVAASESYDGDWNSQGLKLLNIFSSNLIQSNEFFQIALLNLFSRNSSLNHFSALVKLYENSSPYVRRKIILAAKANQASDWLRELKGSYKSMDDWSKRAFLIASKCLPKDEREFFVRQVEKTPCPTNNILVKWIKKRP